MSAEPLSDAFTVTVRDGSDGQVIELAGDLDMETAPRLRAWLEEFTPTGMLVELDTSQLRFVDSTGLGCFYKLHHKVADAGGMVVVPSPPPAVRRLLESTRLNQVVAVTD